jgi:alcohol dehydrogenase (cytochrome c)
MSKRVRSIRQLLLGGVLLAATPAVAADVTSERLVNADKEPQNWLMNHRSYDGQRFSPLARITKDNVKDLKLAYAVALGGNAVNENLESTPLAEDGFLYVVDQWGVVYKIDGRSGDLGRIVWRMDPKQVKAPLANRGAALWGNFVLSAANYPPRIIATAKDTGKVVWESNLSDDQPEVSLTAAPLVVNDKVIVGAAGGDRGLRDYIAGLDAATGKLLWRKYVIPAPGEPGHETWRGPNNAWQTGGGAMWVTGSYDVAGNQVIWGTGNPVPMFDATYRPGDNLYTNSVISWNPDDGRMNWYHQYTPGDHWDYDEAGSHILIDTQVNGEPRKLVTHSGRNGFLYTLERHNGQTVIAKPYLDNVNWTKGIDQKTGKPVDYVPNADFQAYSGLATPAPGQLTKRMCPSPSGGNNFWPSAYSPKTRLIYIPALTACADVTRDTKLSIKVADQMRGGVSQATERSETDISAIDPITGELKAKVHIPYPNYSGALVTAGGVVFSGFTDGSLIAYDDVTLRQLWKFNVGSGFSAPPMTFEVGGRQYVAILSGPSRTALNRHVMTPELKEQRNHTMLFVFGL